MFFSLQKFCVFTFFWLSNEGIKHSFNLSFNYLKLSKLYFLVNKGDLLLKIKHGRNVVWLFLIKLCSFHFNSSSSGLSTFCCTIVIDFCQILLFWRVYLYSSVYVIPQSMMWYELVLLKSNSQMLMKWLSVQFWRCSSCVHVFI